MFFRNKSTPIAAAIATATLLAAAPAQAAIDCDTIRMVVPWKAGGGTDRVGRGLAAALERQSGKSVIVDNISGASSASGSIKAIQAEPDGCTILMNGTTEILAFMTFTQDLPFKLDDMRSVGAFYVTPTWMLSNHKRGYGNLQNFVEAANAKPGKLTIGVGGAAGAHMVMAAAVKGALDLDVRIVPFSGGADLKKALLANQVDAGVIHSPVLLKEIKAGMIDVLATGGSLKNIEHEPLRAMPTLQAQDIDVRMSVLRAVFVPKATPDDVVSELAGWIEAATEDPEFVAFGKKFGFPPVWVSGDELQADLNDGIKFFNTTYENHIKAK